MAKLQVVGSPILAVPFADIAKHGEKVEAAATGLLRAIRDGKLRTLGEFDDACMAAFEANKWNTRPGRPAKDRRQVPHTVRTYVWEIRSAYRAKLEVWTFKTMYELRMAKKALTESAVKMTASDEAAAVQDVSALDVNTQQDLAGVRVVDVDRPNGALFHDLICTFVKLPVEARALLGRQLSRLLHKYLPEAGFPAESKRAKA